MFARPETVFKWVFYGVLSVIGIVSLILLTLVFQPKPTVSQIPVPQSSTTTSLINNPTPQATLPQEVASSPTPIHNVQNTYHLGLKRYQEISLKSLSGATPAFRLNPQKLATQLEFLRLKDANAVSLSQLQDHLINGTALEGNAITWYVDILDNATLEQVLPQLEKIKQPYTLFVTQKADIAQLKALEESAPQYASIGVLLEGENNAVALKKTLEAGLGHPVNFVHDLGGANVKAAGFTLGFGIHTGLLESAPNALALTSFEDLAEGWKQHSASQNAVVLQPLNSSKAVALEPYQFGHLKLVLLRGGRPVSEKWGHRSGVGQFVRATGAVGGINGTFFVDSRLRGTDVTMLGPVKGENGRFVAEYDAYRQKRIEGRPAVFWGPSSIGFASFQPDSMNRLERFKTLMPDVENVFVAGAWMVHGGKAYSTAELRRYATSDFWQIRPRVFMGLDAQNQVVLCATQTPTSTDHLAQIAVKLGLKEAVLLDSGYSTSLIYGNQVLAVGHKTRAVQSRPVPHAIVLFNPSPKMVQASSKSSFKSSKPKL